ncbi:MAG: RNA-binding S4 domain-containing protein [Planctomycetaceae bacterium]|nr:MAG: RNA-binding S4 domain-containing protein [Planctomycetaceae bacterium]
MNSVEHREIRLDQFLKVEGLVGTGGQAKLLIQAGEVLVNGQIETRRRRKLDPGDVVQWGVVRVVVAAPLEGTENRP